MTIAILTQFVRQSTIEMEAEEIKYDLYALRVVGLAGAEGGSSSMHICQHPWVTSEASLGRYHPCVSGIGNYWLLYVVQNKLM